MNKLPLETRVRILSMLCEGSSMRSISRVCDVSINTVDKLLRDAGTACADFHDKNVRNVKAAEVQTDEIWSFCYAKKRNVAKAKAAPEGAGDVWTFTAIDANSKLLISWLVGSRDGETAFSFMDDLGSRLAGRMQLTTDGFAGYRDAVGGAFGSDHVDYGQLVKVYESSPEGQRRYSPARFVTASKTDVFGNPDRAKISTSYVERQNLTMRMSMHRFTRLTNAFSKRFENHCHALALYFFWYNWIRVHKKHKLTPAMAAGLTDRLLDMADLVGLLDAREQEAKRVAIRAKLKFEMLAREKLVAIE
jgi:IS1 family transposase